VDIKPDDDFWTAIENMLRQKDYWYEFKDDTLIIGYGKTVTYVIAMPNVTTEYTASVGGNMLGEGTTNKNLGELSLTTVETGTKYDWAEEKTSRYINRFDVWKSIRQNLDSILRITEERVSTSMGRLQEDVKGQAEGSGSASGPGQASIYGPGTGTGVASYGEKFAGTAGSKMEATGMSLEPATWQRHGEGEYTIDESLGIIKVTTSPKLQESVKEYIDTLKKWLFCQVYIQANILEVELLEESSRGIDWSQVFKAVERETALISGNVEYGDKGSVYEVNFTDAGTFTREGMRLLGKVTLNPTDFKVLVNALDEQGTVHTISEPRLNLLNGSPGVLTVGRSVSYISEITAMRSGESGEVDYTVETADVLEGLAFFVLCNVMENDEIILHLTPVTSQLVGGDAKDPIKYKDFGPNKELTVGLPQVNLRQMSTMAKVKDGDLLILGGLIDEVSSSRGSGIPILSKIPWVKWAFSNEIKSKNRRELIVLLRPHILPM
jgi:general secretion pathway protein D/MSHA biogenesis protein MshL